MLYIISGLSIVFSGEGKGGSLLFFSVIFLVCLVFFFNWGRGRCGINIRLDQFVFAGNFFLNEIYDMLLQGDKVENLRKFVEYLTSQIHQAIPGSEVIWYDSVLNTGQLKWQDELNDKNW